ncbi:MAG: nuclear transport factor 2 family protein [Solirubrobacteraceae bacterium]
MSGSSADVVSGMYEAFARGDVAAILSTVDEQIDWRAPENLPHGGSFSGRDEVGRFFQGIGGLWESLTVDVENILSNGDQVVALVTARGRLRGTDEDTGYTGAHAWTLRDGVPIRFRESVDAPLSLPSAEANA